MATYRSVPEHRKDTVQTLLLFTNIVQHRLIRQIQEVTSNRSVLEVNRDAIKSTLCTSESVEACLDSNKGGKISMDAALRKKAMNGFPELVSRSLVKRLQFCKLFVELGKFRRVVKAQRLSGTEHLDELYRRCGAGVVPTRLQLSRARNRCSDSFWLGRDSDRKASLNEVSWLLLGRVFEHLNKLVGGMLGRHGKGQFDGQITDEVFDR